MYGRSIKCDMCSETEMLPEWPEHQMLDMFPGWIRVQANRPVAYRWERGDSPTSAANDGWDCCSISCARDALRLVDDMIPAKQDAAP